MGPFQPEQHTRDYRDTPACKHLPTTGTVRRENGEEPASLMDYHAYPVMAVCKLCGQTIRLEHFFQVYWDVVPDRQPPSALDLPRVEPGEQAE